MKTIFKSAFSLLLMAVAIFGVNMAVTPQAEAAHVCPSCYVPSNPVGWTFYGCCTKGPRHDPIEYLLYKSPYGQVCLDASSGVPK